MDTMIQSLASLIAKGFPDLGGRCVAVSEVSAFTKETYKPQLPTAVVALISESGNQTLNGGGKIDLSSDILVQFMFEPAKYTRRDGKDTPFFAFYDYESIRNALLALTHNWRSPSNGAITYRSLDVESDEYAVYISFRFLVTEKWCVTDEARDCDPNVNPPTVRISTNILRPASVCCEPEEEPEDPCDFTRV